MRELKSGSVLRRQRGAGLLEVLVAILLLSFGMLAMAGLHAMSFKYGKMSQFRGVATQLAYDLSDRMRANSGGAAQYVFMDPYNATPPAVAVPACADATRCTPAEIAAIDLAEMRNTLRLALPGGGLFVTRDVGVADVVALTVWVLWMDPETADAGALGGVPCPDGVVAANPAPQCLPLRVVL